MAWYPGATKMELHPESDQQPAIRPTQFIVHSIVAPWTPKRTYEYWRDSTNLESHFGLGYDGSLGQFIGTETRADANAAANRRADGTGAISLESASNLQASDPWTPEQIETLIEVGLWSHQEHDIPLRLCRTASDPGFGYHRMFKEWNPDGHSCPGDARAKQFKEVVLPGIIARASGKTPEEDPMAGLSKQDIFDAVWKTDAIAAPGDAPDAKTNPNWQAQSVLKDIQAKVRTAAVTEAAQSAAITKLAQLIGSGVNTDAVVAAVREEIRNAVVKVTVDVTGTKGA
ncbi:N-acetylmuramoyl-L-alanine amidase [Streptomyces sp. NBC_00566]|uniref:N-acetylmuramoyl-L-alanine amidase n=1 Tax=Streptomyces sp. NBC_00566 TaxID=2975778 RepID=UPI002E8035BA|nr:N-acetylmuramoyl-L-alanine amidase [Streptomyces sp. NBC_00566]WUB88273.1 N-acetylmuramoyl-L-alanine amidase [Streptomyces sp. NBC_00566]